MVPHVWIHGGLIVGRGRSQKMIMLCEDGHLRLQGRLPATSPQRYLNEIAVVQKPTGENVIKGQAEEPTTVTSSL